MPMARVWCELETGRKFVTSIEIEPAGPADERPGFACIDDVPDFAVQVGWVVIGEREFGPYQAPPQPDDVPSQG